MIETSRRTFLSAAGSTILATHASLRAAPGAGDYRQDVEIVRRTLALHPGLLRYQTQQQVDQRLAELERQYLAANNLDDRFLVLSAFMSTIKCGHSQCNPYNQRKVVAGALFERPTRLPFEFTWINGKMVVLADRSGTGKVPAGAEVLSINGEASPQLLQRLVRFARADGSNDAKRVAQMAMRNTDRLETFDIYQGLLQPPRRGGFDITYRVPGGRLLQSEFTALTPEQRRATRHTVETDGTSEPFWTWKMMNGVAVLTMPSWVMYNSSWKWEPWLAERLDTLKGARGLIIDLRDNEGGNECGNAILARLSAKDIEFDGYRQLVRYRVTSKELDPFLDTWDPSFRTIGQNAKAVNGGFFELGKEGSDIIPAVGPKLSLPVAALVSPNCSSATFSFARRAKESGLVRLFGETTGGNLRGINGNGYFFVRLPASGLEFDMPIIGNFPVRPQPDRGVSPDVYVTQTAHDIAQGRDPCMIAAKAWVESRGKLA